MRRRSLLTLATAICALAALLPAAAASAADPTVSYRTTAWRYAGGTKVLVLADVTCTKGRRAILVSILRQGTGADYVIGANGDIINAFPPVFTKPFRCTGEPQLRVGVVRTNASNGNGRRFAPGDAYITAQLLIGGIVSEHTADLTLR